MIYPVVMAGGTGSRLWPVSRDNLPKQFVHLQQGKPSLFQQALQRLEGLEGVQPPIVLCNESHRFLVAEQLLETGIGNADIILEPLVRNTAPAVALSAFCALEKNPNAILLILAADHLIEDLPVFHDAIRKAVAAARLGSLVTFGIAAQRPETGYGYIKRAEQLGDLFRIAEFVEKPTLEVARLFLESGDYYWNSGMFVFRADVYLRELKAQSPGIFQHCQTAFRQAEHVGNFYQIPEELFAGSPSDSIDYAVMEHTEEGLVIPLDAQWSDLGAWDALWEKSEKDENGNVTEGDIILHGSTNSFVYSSSRLVSVAGMEDAIVVETADSVLVTTKQNVQDVKLLVQALKKQSRQEAVMPKVVRRPWGSYESLAEGPGFQVKRIIVKPEAALSLQSHQKRAEHWTVVSGLAQVTVDDQIIKMEAGESVYIPVRARHRLENVGEDEVIVIEVQCGSYLGEDDIVRYEDRYGRTS